ncbi:hypothetical protein GQ53DRAFT_748580 [Thozetella sp. PMI_491]|nr:hypothetical protein GQ53DRAFT_748580 [Thozetella sp. PMI_491]
MGAVSQPPTDRPSPQLSPTPSAGQPFDGPADGTGLGLDDRPVPPQWAPWVAGDPRTSSTQSLVSPAVDQDPRRRLLLVYIHGFMGNASSFRSFPAYVHNYLRETLVETHVIHTKIYPRYKTYKAIDVARDNFSLWLEPHESPTTDVILVGHSMGGLLAAEVVLVPSQIPYGHPFRHRILGTVSLDAPLLGLHPGIVVSGIASLFRPSPEPPTDSGAAEHPASPRADTISPDPSVYAEISPPSGAASPTLAAPPAGVASDPFFNPPFFNDVAFKDRGWFKNIAHFANKHKSENLIEAATNHIISHLEFNRCLADYPGMHSRYNKLRALEDVNDPNAGQNRVVRVRFVNYYTASLGRPKVRKETPVTTPSHPSLRPEDAHVLSGRSSQEYESGRTTPSISIEDYSDSERPQVLQVIEPIPEPEENEPPPYSEVVTPSASDPPTTELASITGIASQSSASAEPTKPGPEFQLPAVPDLPAPPQPVNLEEYTDKETRKQAEKEAKRAQKTYDTAVKNRDKAIKERQRLVEKLRRRAAKDAEKREKGAKKEAARRDKEEQKRSRAEQDELERELEQLRLRDHGPELQGKGKEMAKDIAKKERKFCMLPSKVNGQRDSAWQKVFMEGVDEVGAHCGLFLPGPHYEALVGEVGARIVSWVHDDASMRAIQELEMA